MSVPNQANLTVPSATQSSSAGAAIQAINLTKQFGDRVCVDHLSFTVYEGELYALLGDNGAGKTTTINMLTTLLRPTSGQIFLCGFDAVKQTEHTKGAFGVVSQEVSLYGELTAYENLSFIADLYGIPQKVADPRIAELLEHCGLGDRAHDQAGTFSTGMQRKLSIAIAMLHQPKVIFMDEPTVGLDPGARRNIWESLMHLKRSGVTVLLTTHYLEEAEFLADRIGIIRQGKMVMEGTIDHLREQIRAVRSVTIGCSESIDQEEFARMTARFKAKHAGSVEFDSFRNLIVMTPNADVNLTNYLQDALAWLREENIEFETFATSEPSLEEIFLSVQSGRPRAQGQG
jgi:ABC-2 type transport system ATP-binding protein